MSSCLASNIKGDNQSKTFRNSFSVVMPIKFSRNL
jgi:hypothetical protein